MQILQKEPLQLPCNKKIDYSEVKGSIILPFVFELDLAESNLDPGPGENQRFCYNVTGIEGGRCHSANLSHFVLGICDTIPKEHIVNITVTINGMQQTIKYGWKGNVQLKTPQEPDRYTGCAGLKFEFGVNKSGGHMVFCFELTSPYPIGPNPVCLFGGGAAAEGLSICGPVCEEVGTCETAAYQPLSVSVPVKVEPFVSEGEPTTFCCGDPTVIREPARCDCIDKDTCTFVITQNICVRVPVTFGANASVGKAIVQCGEATSEDVCTGCGTGNGSSSGKPPTVKEVLNEPEEIYSPSEEASLNGVLSYESSVLKACLSGNNKMFINQILD